MRKAGTMNFMIPLTGNPLPPGWNLFENREDGASWINKKRKLFVIASIATEQDGKRWLHLSISHRNRMPTYEELTYLKRHWAGEDKKCIMILPEKQKHINIHPYALHLFHCLSGDPLPDFTQGQNTI